MMEQEKREEKIANISPGWVSYVSIRQVEKNDLPALEWDGEYKHFRQVYARAFQRAQEGLSLLWVADLPGKGLIGQIFVQLICDRHDLADGKKRAYFYSFRIREPYRGHGIGLQLLQTVESDLIQRRFRHLTLNVAKENVRAQQFYQRNGYRIIAHEPGRWSYQDDNGIWHDVVEPAWRMEKRLKSIS